MEGVAYIFDDWAIARWAGVPESIGSDCGWHPERRVSSNVVLPEVRISNVT